MLDVCLCLGLESGNLQERGEMFQAPDPCHIGELPGHVVDVAYAGFLVDLHAAIPLPEEDYGMDT
jgi:hypothetical protein